MVLCYGGSGGSEEINDAMKVVIENMVKEDIAFIFATGKYYYEEFTKSIEYLNLKSISTSSSIFRGYGKCTSCK